MTYPTTGGRADAVVSVMFDAGSAAYVNWAGATNGKLSVKNTVTNTVVGDTEDWSLPPKTFKGYSGQDVTMTMDATWASSMHAKTADWAINQRKLSVKISFPNAAAGEISSYTGVALLSDLDLANIGAVDGSKITESVSLEFDGGVTMATVAGA
ncbi:hypothetical protein FGG78_21730 [Thioclava sp. BHET1]|nr:hypothetical protein FGG78_21730 [Thioclava sp. BHET1]